MKSIYYLVPLLNFFLAALLGLFLRSMYVYPLEGWNFLNIMHSHSHTALLGWLYLLVYVLFVQKYAVQTNTELRFYKQLFWVTQFAVIGMVITFPIMGYAAGSIFFSTLHILCSYVFVYRMWKNNVVQGSQQGVLVKTSLFFMLFSTLGVWCLGPAVGLLGKTSAFYQICIQFFLHFQFDGWFLTAFLAFLFTSVLKNKQIPDFKTFYLAWVGSVLLSYALPLSWYVHVSILYPITVISVFLQLYAAGYLIKPILSVFKNRDFSSCKYTSSLLLVSAIGFIIRIIMQLAVVSKVLSVELQTIRSWIVGFIHLNMLGILSCFGLWLFIQEKKIKMDRWIKLGIVFLVLGFGLTEVILFIQGLQAFASFNWFSESALYLFWTSMFLPLGILSFIISYLKELKL